METTDRQYEGAVEANLASLNASNYTAYKE
jgi:hypothetical protein